MTESERPARSRHRLRDLIEEMMASIRVAANEDLWTEVERTRAEADLERIMARVRAEALSRPTVE
jgi:hypothetical protein